MYEHSANGSAAPNSVSLSEPRRAEGPEPSKELEDLVSSSNWRLGLVEVAGEPGDGDGEAPVGADAAPQRAAEQARAAILEQVRAQGHYEATRLREQAIADAEAAKAAMLAQAQVEAAKEAAGLRERAVADAEAAKAAILEQAREQAYYEANVLREQAVGQVEQATVALDLAREQAAREATRLRQEALAEAENLKMAIVEQARAHVREEALRLRDQAIAEADQLKAAIVDRARDTAQRREDALAEAERLRAEAQRLYADAEHQRAEAAKQRRRDSARPEEPAIANPHVAPDTAEVTLIRANEIAAREFPTVRRGYDPESVTKWLSLVELSYAVLEQELSKARAEWDRALDVLSVTRLLLKKSGSAGHPLEVPFDREFERARREWARSLENLGRAREHGSDSSFRSVLVGAAQLEAKLGRQLFGYSTSQVGRLLDSSLSQLARLENQVAVLRAENDELRARMLRQLSDPDAISTVVGPESHAAGTAMGEIGASELLPTVDPIVPVPATGKEVS